MVLHDVPAVTSATEPAYTTNTETTTTTVTTTTTQQTVSMYGDANCDGEVNIADVIAIATYVADPNKNPLTAQGKINADVHMTGNDLNASNALAIQMYLIGVLESLPVK